MVNDFVCFVDFLDGCVPDCEFSSGKPAEVARDKQTANDKGRGAIDVRR
jgi:hypothetical protein